MSDERPPACSGALVLLLAPPADHAGARLTAYRRLLNWSRRRNEVIVDCAISETRRFIALVVFFKGWF
jgi:hypothetical protein